MSARKLQKRKNELPLLCGRPSLARGQASGLFPPLPPAQRLRDSVRRPRDRREHGETRFPALLLEGGGALYTLGALRWPEDVDDGRAGGGIRCSKRARVTGAGASVRAKVDRGRERVQPAPPLSIPSSCALHAARAPRERQ